MSYRQLTKGVLRLSDNLTITRDMIEWEEEYRPWTKSGGVPEPEIVVIPPRWASLEAAQLDVWTATKSKRDALEATTFPFMGHPVDSDPRSVQRINTAVQAAQAALGAGQPYQVGWTCHDDHVLVLDAAAMSYMPVALATYANSLHLTARAFKDRINAPTVTIADLELIAAEVEAWI